MEISTTIKLFDPTVQSLGYNKASFTTAKQTFSSHVLFQFYLAKYLQIC